MRKMVELVGSIPVGIHPFEKHLGTHPPYLPLSTSYWVGICQHPTMLMRTAAYISTLVSYEGRAATS